VPQKERGIRRYGAVDEVQRPPHQFGVYVFHVDRRGIIHAGMRWQGTCVGDDLLADPAPAWVLGGVIDVTGLGVDDVSWAEAFVEPVDLGILRVVGLLHRVEVIQDAVELVEAVDGGA
jgi:hypothetical protein